MDVNSIVVDSKSDCVICESGKYQNLLGSASCKECETVKIQAVYIY